MTLQDLLDEARARTNDVAAPYFCSDARFTNFANEAQREACRRARLIVDSTTASVCQIAITSNNAIYPLDPSVLFVRRATVDGQSRPLVRVHHRDLDARGTEWMTETGDIDAWVVGLDSRKLRLYRVPTANGVLRLTVQRLPLAKLVVPTDLPEVDERYHERLVDWMLYRYYSTNDAELRDDKAAQNALAAFEGEFGPPATAIEEAWAQEHYGFSEDGSVYGG